jgi:hypothetical protein
MRKSGFGMKFPSIYYFAIQPLTADESIDAPFNPAPKFTSGNKVQRETVDQ